MTDAPLLFARGGRSIVGEGEVERVEFAGADQIADAAEWWRQRVSAARLDERDDDATAALGAAALGPAAFDAVAFGAFAFDAARSATPGVLLVPERIVRPAGAAPRGTRPPRAQREIDGEGEVEVLDGDMSSQAYQDAVAAAVAAIAAGRVEKVVLARDVVIRRTHPFRADELADRLDRTDERSAAFVIDGMFGASPETLVAVHGGRFSARVLAGTAATADGDTLLTSAKNRAEHAYAVASVLDALAGHVRDVEAAATPSLLRLPHLSHLATDVTGVVADGASVLDLVGALHPTAAVAGTPTSAAVDLIRELERFDRGRYAGPVGWVDAAGDGEWAIALRCARIEHDGTVRAYAGAGIVAASDPAAELAETSLKLRAILDVVR